jgi:Poxvirus Late Transcription Factor VLTF3 like
MPSFKPKTTKKIKISKKMATTLDGKHKEFLNDFSKDETDRIPKLKKKRSEINILLLKQDIVLEEKLDLQDKLKEINEEISYLKSKKINYFLDNSKYIFDYFENKKEISTGNQVPSSTGVKSKLIDNFFKIKTDMSNNNFIEKTNNNLFQKYLNNIDETFLDVNSFVYPTDVCQSCFKGELIPMDDEGLLSCNNCFKSILYLIENEKPSYKEPPKEVCFYAYKKINHFKEILAQYQGKETTQIPDEVIENLKQQIKKERIELKSISYYETKLLLKKLGYNKYYEHINFIKDKLGIKPPIISQELEETLCNFFMEIQYPYARHCPDYRVNFLHYYYVLYKLFELLNEKQYLPEIPMLKDREKLIEQDTIWKKICQDLDWEFIPTI